MFWLFTSRISKGKHWMRFRQTKRLRERKRKREAPTHRQRRSSKKKRSQLPTDPEKLISYSFFFLFFLASSSSSSSSSFFLYFLIYLSVSFTNTAPGTSESQSGKKSTGPLACRIRLVHIWYVYTFAQFFFYFLICMYINPIFFISNTNTSIESDH